MKGRVIRNSALVVAAIAIVAGTTAALFSQTGEEGAGKIRLSISSFDDTVTQASEQERAGKVLTPGITRAFTSADRFFVRDPGAISEYLNRLSQAQVGLIDPESMRGEAEKLKIDYLAVGTVSKFGGNYEVDARTVSINSWKIIHAQGCTAPDLQTAIKEIGWYIKEQFTENYTAQRLKEGTANPVVSVAQFRDNNSDAQRVGYSGTFAEILNSELGSYVLLTTVERKYARALMNEKTLEMAGVFENDTTARDFNVRGIEYLLEGDVRAFKDTTCVNFRLMNTGDRRMVFLGSTEFKSAQGLRTTARDIAHTIDDVLNNRLGTLTVGSLPTGADIFLDNEPMGTTPATFSVSTGKHNLWLKMAGYETAKKDVEIKAKQIAVEVVPLVRMSLKLLNEAYDLESKGNWAGAVAAYEKFIEAFKDTDDANSAFYRKGHVELLYLKQYQSALATFSELVSRYPETMTRAEGYYGLVKSYLALGDAEKARETLKFLLEKYGDTPAAEEARKLQI